MLLCCRANADSPCPPRGHGREQREQFVMSVFSELGVCVCAFGTYRLFFTVLAYFPNRYRPKRALCMCESHVESLRPCCAGVTVYKGKLFPLWFVIDPGFLLIGPKSFSCTPVGWQLFPVSHPQYETVSMLLCLD